MYAFQMLIIVKDKYTNNSYIFYITIIFDILILIISEKSLTRVIFVSVNVK